jgi:ADP-ribose pyrophosphatase YjhB (NUDIX family)
MTNKYKWLKWANELQSIAQAGLTYSTNEFDLQRYRQIQTLSSEILAHHSFDSFEKIKQLLAQEQYYLTPKLDVRTAIIQNDEILMVKETSDGKWTLPGGFADVNESPSESAKKEVFEETGYQVHITKLYAVIDKHKRNYPPQIHHAYKCFFLGHILAGHATPSIETSEIRFFKKNELPELSRHRIMPEQIELAFTHHAFPDLPTEFD